MLYCRNDGSKTERGRQESERGEHNGRQRQSKADGLQEIAQRSEGFGGSHVLAAGRVD
jgi:hypothetical protein